MHRWVQMVGIANRTKRNSLALQACRVLLLIAPNEHFPLDRPGFFKRPATDQRSIERRYRIMKNPIARSGQDPGRFQQDVY